MKANEAPEKIYITNYDIEALPKNEQLSERWHEVSIQDTDIEYTRTDAFIEKACEFLDGCYFDYIDLEHANVDTFMNVDNKRFIEDFKKYME